MQESPFYRAAARFCVRNRVPLVLIVHDLVDLFEPVLPWAINRRQQINTEILRSAAARFCISPVMVDHLRKEYGVDSTVLYPSRSEDLVPRRSAMSEALRNEGRLTIAYAGSLSYGYGEAVRNLLPALQSAGAVLRVYAPTAPADLGEHLEYAGYSPAPMQTWERIKDECDAVLLPYAWPEHFRTLYETHFPSKLTEYLGLGMPLLISGPAYAAGVAWGLRHPRAAVTVSNPREEAMRAACVRLRDDAALRMSLATEGVHAGNEEFDPIGIRNQFLQRLRDLNDPPSRTSPTPGI
jgi:glycosyltransferase involved in cell wall biosynthesis